MTIDDQKGRIIASVFELSSIIEDFQMQSAGVLMSGLNIWLFGLLPSLMTNTEMWTEILSDSLQMAKEMFMVQFSQPLPGLVPECRNLPKSLNLPNLFDSNVSKGMTKIAWKRIVNKSIR